MPAFLRNIITGEIKQLESWTEDWEKARLERDGNGYPVWEETGAHDAAPDGFAHADEVASREQHGVQPLSDITSDGVPTSAAGAANLVGTDPQDAPVAPGPPVIVLPQSPALAPEAPSPKAKTKPSEAPGK